MTDDFDRVLSDHLQAEARALAPAPGDVGRVMAHGHRRRRRTRTVIAAAAFVAGGSGAGAVVANHGSNGPAPRLQVGGETASGATPSPSSPAANLVWRASVVASSLYLPAPAYVSTLEPSQPVYSVSSAPGVADLAKPGRRDTLYRSADGRSWTVTTPPPGLSLSATAVDGDQVYAVGTGTATAAIDGGVLGSGFAVAKRTGATGAWSSATLPLQLAAPAGALHVINATATLAAGPKGTLAVVGVAATLDLRLLLPHVAVGRWTPTVTGVEMLGAERAKPCGPGSSLTPASGTVPPTTSAGPALSNSSGEVTSVGCYRGGANTTIAADAAYNVTKSYRWSQLGIGAQTGLGVAGAPIAFWSADGVSFAPVTLPPGVVSYGDHAVAGPDGFALLTASGASGGSVLMRSPDGRAWTVQPGASGGGSIYDVGYVGDALTAIQVGASGSVQAVSYHGAVGTVTDLSAAAGMGHQQLSPGPTSFGPLGVMTSLMNGGSSALLYSPDGATWAHYDLQTLAGPTKVAFVSNVVVSGTDVVVTAAPMAKHANKPLDQVTIVGTRAT